MVFFQKVIDMGQDVFFVRVFETSIGLVNFVNRNEITREQIVSITTPIDKRYEGLLDTKDYSNKYTVFFYYHRLFKYDTVGYINLEGGSERRSKFYKIQSILRREDKVSEFRIRDLIYPVNPLDDPLSEEEFQKLIREYNGV
jgi:hypothetical protein